MTLSSYLDSELNDCEFRGLAYVPLSRNVRQTLWRNARRENSVICSPYRGFFAHRKWWESLTPIEQTRTLIQTLATVHQKWVFCGLSAAIVCGICDSYYLMDGKFHILSPSSVRRHSSKRVVSHYANETELSEISYARSVTVTRMERTVFDCVRELEFSEALGIVDAALRSEWVSMKSLMEYCMSHMTYRNARRAMICISYGDGLSENGGESYARAQMICLGFEPPELQVNFFDPLRKKKSRVDYFWEHGARGPVVFEFHGRQKYVDPVMTQGKSVREIESAEEKRGHRLSLQGVSVNDIDFDDIHNLSVLQRELAIYGVPRRKGAKSGFLEFNHAVPYLGIGYPPSVRV
ncbi:MAG: hypothetical protein LKJ47_01080 [Bifidobacteriaceae bacterium]|jgi:hypothetical protein|nr:hypothetical protein [Bifidobacteriaceae bacterium]